MTTTRPPVLSLLAAALALSAGSGMSFPAEIAGPSRRREPRCGGYAPPPSRPRELTPEEVAAAGRRERRNAKRVEQMRRAAKGGA